MRDPSTAQTIIARQQGTLNPRPEEVRHESFRNSDFFDPEDLLQVKYEMLRHVDVDKQPVSQAAKTFGFSRPSFYQAQAAFQEAGLAGLLPQKRGPRSGHKLTGELMHFVTQLRAAEPDVSTSQLAKRVAKRVNQLHFPAAARSAVLLAPKLDQEQLMSKISDVLNRTGAIGIIKEIRNDDRQTALRVIGEKLPGGLEVTGRACWFEPAKVVFGWLEAMPTGATAKGIVKLGGERLQQDTIEAHQADINKSSSEPPLEEVTVDERFLHCFLVPI